MTVNKSIDSKKIWFVALITLSSIGFFKPAIVPEDSSIYSYVYMLLILVSFPIIVRSYFREFNSILQGAMKLFVLSILLSMVSAFVFWGQGPIDSVFGALFSFLGYTFYFYLLQSRVSASSIESLIIKIGVAFITFFLLSFLLYPIKIFHYPEASDRELQRIFLSGDGFLFLIFFLAINKFKTTNDKKWLLLALMGFVCIVLNQTRVYIISSLAISMFYFLQAVKIHFRLLLIGFFITLGIFVSQLNFVQGLQNRTNNELSDVNEYIRFQAGEYFLTTFQPSPVTMIIGNGKGYGDKTSYGKKLLQLREQGFFVEDLGFIGLFIYLGALGVFSYILVLITALRSKIPSEFLYLKMFLFFLITSGLTTSNTFNSGFMLSIVLTLYMIEKTSLRKVKIKISPQT